MEKRIFAVDDFIVGKGEQKILGESVEKRKGEFVVLVFTVDGVGRKIF